MDTIQSLQRHAQRDDGKRRVKVALRPKRKPTERRKTSQITPSDQVQSTVRRSAKTALKRAIATPGALRRVYLQALVPAHRLYRDRHMEKLLFKPSILRPAGRETGRGAEPLYDGPIPGQVLDWIIADLNVTLREYAFVDLRAGNGRTLLYAAMHDFERVIGYEYDPDAHDNAQLNIGQFPRTYMKCRDVEIRRGDQTDLALPEQPLVVFCPSGARERFPSLVLDHVSAAYRQNPRRMFLIMENTKEEAASGLEDVFEDLKLAMLTQLKLRLLSPVDVRVLRSLV